VHPYVVGFRAYPSCIVLGFLTAVAVGAYAARRAGVPRGHVALHALVLTSAGVLGAKLHSLVETEGLRHIGWAALLGAGYRYPGGILAVLLALAGLSRLAPGHMGPAAVGDLVAPALGFGVAVMRLGCFLGGCCFGVVSGLPWALSFPRYSPPWNDHVARQWLSPDARGSLPVHPLQLYFAALALLAGAFASWFQPRKQYDGQVLLLFLVIHESGKLALELLRSPELTQTTWHLKAGPLAVATVAAAILLRRRRAGSRMSSPPATGRRSRGCAGA
jgi:phosphatidylglycerol:prolipoprotein diacylglycerol transferase